MGYKLTRNSVLRNKPELDQILASKGVIRFHTNNPAGLQKNIHEALAASAEFPEFRHYHDRIKPHYTIRTKKGMVIVEPKEEVLITRTEVLNEDARFVEVSLEKAEKVVAEAFGISPKPETNQASTLAEVLLAAIQAEDSTTDLIFPKANELTLEEKRRLNKWCVEKGVNFIDQDEAGLTLTRRQVDPSLTWKEPENGN